MTRIPRRRLTQVEGKVLTLFALDQLGECGNLQLISFMAETEVMNYFDLQAALAELRDTGQVFRSPMAADDLYRLTDAGREALRFFLPRAAASSVDRIRQAAPVFRQRFGRERELSSRILHEGVGEYRVHCRIEEQGMSLLALDLSLPTAELAVRFRDRWPQKARRIYDFVIGELSGEAGT